MTLSRLADMSRRSAGPFDAVMHDLDHMDARFVGAIVTELLSGPAPLPAAVHGYNLGDEEMMALHADGVAVSRRLNPQLVRALCRAVERAPTAACEPSHRDSPEASDDPSVLCEMVRSLATHAHRALPRGSAESPDAPAA